MQVKEEHQFLYVLCCVVKEVSVGRPSSCIAFMDHGVVYATNKFYVLSFNGFTVTGRQI